MESKKIVKGANSPISNQELSMQKAFERALVNVWLPSQVKLGGRNDAIDIALTAINNQVSDKMECIWGDLPAPPTPPPPREVDYHRVASLDLASLKAKRSLDLAGALQVFSILLQLATVALLALALGRL